MAFYYAEERTRLEGSQNIAVRFIANEATFVLAAAHLDATHIVSDEHGSVMLWKRNTNITGNGPFDKPDWEWVSRND